MNARSTTSFYLQPVPVDVKTASKTTISYVRDAKFQTDGRDTISQCDISDTSTWTQHQINCSTLCKLHYLFCQMHFIWKSDARRSHPLFGFYTNVIRLILAGWYRIHNWCMAVNWIVRRLHELFLLGGFCFHDIWGLHIHASHSMEFFSAPIELELRATEIFHHTILWHGIWTRTILDPILKTRA